MNIKQLINEMLHETLAEAVAKIACLKCDEVSTAAAWKKKGGFCPKCKVSSQGVAEETELTEAKFKLGDTVMDKKGNGEFIITEVIPHVIANKPAAYRIARPTGTQSPNIWPESRLKLIKSVKESLDLSEDVHNDLSDLLIKFERDLIKFMNPKSGVDAQVRNELGKAAAIIEKTRQGRLFKIRPGR